MTRRPANWSRYFTGDRHCVPQHLSSTIIFWASILQVTLLEDLLVFFNYPYLSVGMIGQEAQRCGSNPKRRTRSRTPIVDIYYLSDEVLLRMFYYCRPVLLDEDVADDNPNLEGKEWSNERWWYKLAHICRKWRYLVLASASHLRLHLLCTYGTSVAAMLTYPPSFPLIIDYSDENREMTAEDEEGILLALRRRRRVRRIRLWMPAASLRRLLATIDGDFPMLENLYIKPLTNDDNGLSLPWTFHAPHLRDFVLRKVAYPLYMLHPPPPVPYLPPTEIINKLSPHYGSQLWRSLRIFVHILDNDSLLNIFHLCRPALVDEDEADIFRMLQGGEWDRERWWYRFAHVCRRWRCLILASASYLRLSLLCKRGTPVADLLTTSPPLPLVIDHIHSNASITVEEEDGIALALQHRDRVRRIRLLIPLSNLEKLVRFIDEEFPMLEYLYISLPTKRNTWLMLPHTFHAPHLRHLIMKDFALPTISSLITTNTGLTTLSLSSIPQSMFPHPNDLLQKISLMPQLETLRIVFHPPVPSRHSEGLLTHRPVMTRVTFPNLRWFGLRSTCTYMEALVPRMTTPLLERLETHFFRQLSFSIPHLLEFMSAAKNLRLGSARFQFSDNDMSVYVYPYDGSPTHSFSAGLVCEHFNSQISFAAQFFRTLRPVFSSVEHLTLEFWRRSRSSEMNDGADMITQWRELLRSFSNVKILRVNEDFRGQISRSLQVDDGESPLDLLPELEVLHFPERRSVPDAFLAFVHARRIADRPVTLLCF